jgi:hypothetical protein
MLQRFVLIYDAIQLLAATGNLNDCDILPLKDSSFLDFQQYVMILQPIEKFIRLKWKVKNI